MPTAAYKKILSTQLGIFFKPQTIQKFLKQINPNRLILVYTSPKNITDAKIEKWYQAKYRTRSISTKEISDWKNYEKKHFSLPLANDFLLTENPTFYSSEKKGDGQPILEFLQRKDTKSIMWKTISFRFLR